MDRRPPRTLWAALIILGAISAVQLLIGLTRGQTGLLIAVVLNVMLIIGMRAGRPWAYLLTLLVCVINMAAALYGQLHRPTELAVVLAFNGLVVVLVFLATDYFLGKSEPAELPDPLRCPKCGYSLLGLTKPRCPECGQQFKEPR
jgi:hypothetical protein